MFIDCLKTKGKKARWISMLMIVVLIFSMLCGCGASKARGDAEPEQSPSEVTTEIEEQEEPQQDSEQPAEDVSSEPEVFDTSETEIRGGTNQADAMQLPMNTKVYGTLQDGQNMFLSFHTGPSAESTYQITVVNKTPMDEYAKICFYVFDELGTEVADGSAYDSGVAKTLSVEGLSSNTDYYIRLVVKDSLEIGTYGKTARFAIIIRDANAQVEGINTTNNFVDAIAPLDDLDKLVVGTNQDDSALIPFDKTVSGELKDALGGWFAFATTENAESSYQISVVDKLFDDYYKIGFYVFDEFGEEISSANAYGDGVAKTIVLEGLRPNTVYYIRLVATDKLNVGTTKTTVGYALTVRCQNNTPEANTATVEDAEDVVFETPFELSATQVRFVINQAIFIDENEAKAALAPVAEVILAHPDHPILLAGTTATDGTQESCIGLSNRRADAVKNLLVNYFGVPESQLITVGLGYADDPFVRGRDRDDNGNFVETEGAKNRRVVVLDAESDIAKQILGN